MIWLWLTSTLLVLLLWASSLVLLWRLRVRLLQQVTAVIEASVVEELHKQDERIQRRLSRLDQQPPDNGTSKDLSNPPPLNLVAGSNLKRFRNRA
jgi:hypothetical protein